MLVLKNFQFSKHGSVPLICWGNSWMTPYIQTLLQIHRGIWALISNPRKSTTMKRKKTKHQCTLSSDPLRLTQEAKTYTASWNKHCVVFLWQDQTLSNISRRRRSMKNQSKKLSLSFCFGTEMLLRHLVTCVSWGSPTQRGQNWQGAQISAQISSILAINLSFRQG